MKRSKFMVLLMMISCLQAWSQDIMIRTGPEKGRTVRLIKMQKFLDYPVYVNLADFRSFLECNGLHETGYNYEQGKGMAGKYGNVLMDGLILHGNPNKGKMYGLTLITHPFSWSGSQGTLDDLRGYIEKKYPDAIRVEYDDTEDQMQEYDYIVDGVGSVRLSYTLVNGHTVKLQFLDFRGCKEMTGRNPERVWYNAKDLVNVYQDCYIGFSEDEVMFQVSALGKIVRFSARNDDKDGIYYLLNNCTDTSILKRVLTRYVKELGSNTLASESKAIPIYSTRLQKVCAKVAEERQKELQAQKARQSTQKISVRNMFLDMIINKVYSKSDQKLYEDLIGREGMRAIVGAGMGAVMGKPGAYEYNGQRFNNEAEMEDYKNAYGYK